jgi:hypothetical protein
MDSIVVINDKIITNNYTKQHNTKQHKTTQNNTTLTRSQGSRKWDPLCKIKDFARILCRIAKAEGR